jgi:hypothetical protein
MGGRSAASLVFALAAVPAAHAASVQTLGFDLLNVLKVAYYPLQVMAYCYKEVSPNRDFQTAGNEWNRRNSDLLTKLEDKAKAEHISNDLRVAADKETLAAIQKVVGSQTDKVAYCRLIVSLVDGGQYDLTIRDDLKQPLKRIFPQ